MVQCPGITRGAFEREVEEGGLFEFVFFWQKFLNFQLSNNWLKLGISYLFILHI